MVVTSTRRMGLLSKNTAKSRGPEHGGRCVSEGWTTDDSEQPGPRCRVRDVRTTAERVADARAKLIGDADVWIATGDSRGVAHLVPLSLCWYEGEIVVATESRSRTARNAVVSAQARLALGSTRDVVSIEATATIVARADANPSMVDEYRARVGWDPGADGGEWVFIRCSPVSVQVWRDVDEIAGRTVMRRGTWIE
jgi:Pyridoxamine 5'-phosphate oxidase